MAEKTMWTCPECGNQDRASIASVGSILAPHRFLCCLCACEWTTGADAITTVLSDRPEPLVDEPEPEDL